MDHYTKIILQSMRDVATETFVPAADVEGYKQRMAEAALNRRASPTAPDWDASSTSSSGYDPFNVSPVDHSAAPAPAAANLDAPWGDRSPAPNRNDVDDRMTINFPGRYVEGAGEQAEKPRIPKVRG